jgi:hypothetical protein
MPAIRRSQTLSIASGSVTDGRTAGLPGPETGLGLVGAREAFGISGAANVRSVTGLGAGLHAISLVGSGCKSMPITIGNFLCAGQREVGAWRCSRTHRNTGTHWHACLTIGRVANPHIGAVHMGHQSGGTHWSAAAGCRVMSFFNDLPPPVTRWCPTLSHPRRGTPGTVGHPEKRLNSAVFCRVSHAYHPYHPKLQNLR